ncbi:hypothetical protein GYMLUDRAFT_72662 [Collybiopsis luxurians FD-317 M1]|uniref:Ankyrin n=1 Tax=Collybiopsis luxurians FD-317 M1 TaxID=944289 RepID=A0A0D0CSU2_9AGAR|nr:hypothetical protein GYMLUDRAFT_72662 [Collybiopsis luxurians FD-317 M1]
MTSVYTSTVSAHNYGLHIWALEGNSEGVREAINAGANVNDLDASGRSPLMCAIAGVHWSDISVSHDDTFMNASRLEAIDAILRHPEVSLFTLNAPQQAFNDATPLGMAAWLSMPEAVRVLLKGSQGSVAVDGTDMHGSTPLMYAARDGHYEIVKSLIEHGSRPDLRALSHRTAVQYALSHPRVLYLCETMLRQYRLHEWKLTNKSGVLAESDDPLRRAASSIPFIEGLDAPSLSEFSQNSLEKWTSTILQYLRTDDVQGLLTLFDPSISPSICPPLVNYRDPNGWSPIHHSACMSEPSVKILDTLYCAGADVALFTEHEHYTALHCFAFSDHGKCPTEALYQYVSHLVHDLRAPLSATDKNGDTCIHIAAKHAHSPEVLQILLKFDPSHSVRDLCNAKGLTAWEAAKPEFRLAFGELELLRPESSLSTYTLRPTYGQYSIESHLDEITEFHYQRRISSTTLDFDVTAASHQLIDNLRISSPSMHHDTDVQHIRHLESLTVEMDRIHGAIIDYLRARVKEVWDVLKDMEDDARDMTVLLDSTTCLVNVKLEERGLEPWTQTRASEDSDLTCVSSGERSLTGTKSATPSIIISEDGSPSLLEKKATSTTSRFVAWIKRKSSATAIPKVAGSPSPPPMPCQEETQMLLRSPRNSNDSKNMTCNSINAALRTSGITLGAVGKDLEDIRDSLVSSKVLLDSASRSISRADRILKRALKARKAMISNLPVKVEDDLFIRSVSTSLSAKSSFASIISVSTVASKVSIGSKSFTGNLADNDDEETRAIRRLLLRKIDARHDGVLEETEKIARWLGVVRDVVNSIKRRTYV